MLVSYYIAHPPPTIDQEQVCNRESYHFIIFRGQLEDTSQLGIHEIIRLCIFPLMKEEKYGMLFISSHCQQLESIHTHIYGL